MNQDNREQRRRRRLKVIALPAAGLALTAGLGTAAGMAHPASAAPAGNVAQVGALKGAPGIGDIVSMGSTIYGFVAQCENNLDNNISCLQGSGKSIAEIHGIVSDIRNKLDAFTAQYAKDQEQTQQALDTVIQNQANAEVRAQWTTVRADLETAHVSLKLYDGYVDCLNSATSAQAGGETPTCEVIDLAGKPTGETVPADLNHIQAAERKFLEYQVKNQHAVGGYTLQAADLVQRISGTTTDPYASPSLMNAILNREEVAEKVRQGLPAASKLRVIPASYVNKIGEYESAMIERENTYFAMRIIAANMSGETDLAKTWAGLANNGRQDLSPVLSLAQQSTAFTFPGWSRENKLPANQYYFNGPRTGLVKITNHGMTKQPMMGNQLPTRHEIQNLAADIDESGTTYSQQVAANGSAIPGPISQAGHGNATAAGYLWSRPEDVGMKHFTSKHEGDDGEQFYYRGSSSGTKVREFDAHTLFEMGSWTFGGDRGISQKSVLMSVFNNPQNGTAGGSMGFPDGEWFYPGSANNYATPTWDFYYEKVTHQSKPSRMYPKGHPVTNSYGPHGGGSAVFVSGMYSMSGAQITIAPQEVGGALQK